MNSYNPLSAEFIGWSDVQVEAKMLGIFYRMRTLWNHPFRGEIRLALQRINT